MEKMNDLVERELEFMAKAVEEAYAAAESGGGGPFGAVIVGRDDGEIIVSCGNLTLIDNDPTAHAEVVAIREACKKLSRTNLSDCVMYTSCEPCPMCFAAIYYSKFKTVVYGAKAKSAYEAMGYDPFVGDALKGAEYFRKGHLEIFRAHDAAAALAEQVFETMKQKKKKQEEQHQQECE